MSKQQSNVESVEFVPLGELKKAMQKILSAPKPKEDEDKSKAEKSVKIRGGAGGS